METIPTVPPITWEDSPPLGAKSECHIAIKADAVHTTLFLLDGKCSFCWHRKHRPYTELAIGVLIAVRICRRSGQEIDSFTLRTNIATNRLTRAIYADSHDHRQRIHLENGIEDEIKKFLREDEITFRIAPDEPCMTSLDPMQQTTSIPQQVSLIAQGEPTDKYKTMLQYVPSGQEYRTYLSEKYGLTNCWDSIDWMAFRKAKTRFSHDGPALTKMLNGWLATAETVRKRSQHELQRCPFCGQAENTSHLLLCHETKRAATIDQQLSALWSNLASTLPATLHESLRDATEKWRTSSNDDTILNHEHAIISQSEIGWGQFFRGRITTAIQESISQHLQTHGHRNYVRAAHKKCVSLIHELWQCMLKLWQSRNKRAVDTSCPEPTIQRTKWQSTVRYFYAHQHYFPANDRQTLFAIPVDRLCSATEATLASWCTQIQSVYQQCKEKTARAIATTHRPLSDYFISTARPPG